MKIKNVTIQQGELDEREVEILSKIKTYCQRRFDCDGCYGCIFNQAKRNCLMTPIWNELKKLNIKYEDIKEN